MKVFITGITGTLGVAFTELLKDQHEVSGVDRNEQGVARFQHQYPEVPVKLGDFSEHLPKDAGVVIHLAAMKHIDLCEQNPNECVTNNVVKTQSLFKQAYEQNTGILFMSTDKAVEPVCMY